MTTFTPFADDSSVVAAGDLSIENGRDAIAVHGSLDIRRDRVGLEAARALAAAFDAIARDLSGRDLPERADDDAQQGGSIDNPFT